MVDVDRFLALNQPAWDRLEALTRAAERGVARLSAPELDELVRLYQRASSHLSYARTYFRDPALTARLTSLVGRANAVVYGSRKRSVRSIGAFFTRTFPAVVWESRRFIAVSAVLFFVPAIVVGTWLAHSPKAIDAVGSAALRQTYVNHDFAAYYRSQPSAQFAAKVQTNNITVAFLAFAGGITGCVLTVFALAQNGASVGMAGGLFANAHKLPVFFGLILPHGLLELTSVVIAGGAGLRLGWALISPGDRSRSAALAEEGRRSVTLVAGLILTFVVAGLIEGFVAGSALSTPVRVGIGAVAEGLFLVYVVVLGRAASAPGVIEVPHG
ncbi:MAG TPA: stage II sporulation protein M [Acidimicrobiales bacterium]|nr:stage II sporulation protein M [Acidimicrobiales bacterium]